MLKRLAVHSISFPRSSLWKWLPMFLVVRFLVVPLFVPWITNNPSTVNALFLFVHALTFFASLVPSRFVVWLAVCDLFLVLRGRRSGGGTPSNTMMVRPSLERSLKLLLDRIRASLVCWAVYHVSVQYAWAGTSLILVDAVSRAVESVKNSNNSNRAATGGGTAATRRTSSVLNSTRCTVVDEGPIFQFSRRGALQ